MGEAKRREQLGTTRQVHFTRWELLDVINFLVPLAPQPGQPPPPAPKKKLDRDGRRALRSALDQLGIRELWYKAKSGPIMPGEVPEWQVREVTVDAINVLLGTFKAELDDHGDYRDLMNIGEIEDRLEDAKSGDYVLPPEPKPAKPPGEQAFAEPAVEVPAPAPPADEQAAPVPEAEPAVAAAE